MKRFAAILKPLLLTGSLCCLGACSPLIQAVHSTHGTLRAQGLDAATPVDSDAEAQSAVSLPSGLHARPTTVLPTGLQWVLLGGERLSDGRLLGVWVVQPTVIASLPGEPLR